jgi:predicted ArsR family transcriptional regulator
MSTLQEQARALGDPTRHAIFARLAAAGRPLGVAELNEHFALNHNAIRQHLAKLVAAGLVVEAKAGRTGPGRPRLVYTLSQSVEGRWGTTGPYERLSHLLAEVISTGLDPEGVGRRAADRFRVPSPSGDAVTDLAAAMARQGFEPEVRGTRTGTEVILHQCPFVSTALAHRETVCALHLGIAQGLVDGTDLVVRELVANDPRTADCRIRLRPDGAEGESVADGTLSLRGRATARRR